VCRLKKALYALKEAPNAWYSRIDEYLFNLGFTKTTTDPNLSYLYDKSDLLVLVFYVYEFILTSSYGKLIGWCKEKLANKIDMKDIGLMHNFLGLEVWQVRSSLSKGSTWWRF
jgi:hypothetical protein